MSVLLLGLFALGLPSVRLSNPIADISRSDFGRILAVQPARTMQLGVRFTF
jgi:hypothetical protein